MNTLQPRARSLEPSSLRRGWVALGALGLASFAVAGCGFKLRGPAPMPFRKLYSGFARNSAIGAELRSLIRVSSDTVVVDRLEEADARLEVLLERREREIVAFTSTGRPREYQLRLRVRVRVLDARGVEWMPPTELVLRREITSSDIEVVNRAQEEELLYREMESDYVQQLLRRLAALKPLS
jgi:LPS-assembly lipoprotein